MMGTEQENIGHYLAGLGKKKSVIFSFEPAVKLLLSADAGDQPNRFRFDRQIALLLLFFWSLWPDDDAILKTASRLIADAITFYRRGKPGNITDKRIKKLASIRARLEEPWYQTFYERFYAHFGGLASDRLMWTRSDFDEIVVDRQRELNTSLDLIEFLLRMSKVDSKLATLKFGDKFIERDGFQRYVSYALQSGEKTKRKKGLKASTISKRWEDAPNTIGLAYIIRRSLPDLWTIKMTDRRLLTWLADYAADRVRLKMALSQYHWLVAHLKQCTQIDKFDVCPTVDDFDQEGLDISPFSDDERKIMVSIRPGCADQLMPSSHSD